MKDIKLLDCTLRDGGYVNDWEFGRNTITCIFERLVQAGIDLIEVGFLDERRPFDANRTIQPTTSCYDEIFRPCSKGSSKVMAMIDYGTCDINNLAPCEESFIDGIRVIFKKPKMHAAVDFARQVIDKDYAVSLQLVSITSYRDKDLLELIDLINQINPFAVSMVDTYGLMHKEQMAHYFHLLDYNLNPGITIGYHSHNNFQLGYANEIEMIKRHSTHNILVDGTAYGMGKSAGNAPLELLAMHLNDNYGKNYKIDQILEIIDGNIMRIYREHYWGYSLAFFLAASNNCHPNYIKYLLNKHTLSVKGINDIAKNIAPDLKLNYSQSHIEELYKQYQEKTVFESKTIQHLSSDNKLRTRKILLLGPGKSLVTQRDVIESYIAQNDPIVIAVNCIPQEYAPHYVFISNSKRYSSLYLAFRNLPSDCKIIATSNVVSAGRPFDYVFRYDTLRDDDKNIEDNAFIMAIKALIRIGVKEAAAAGCDGFSKQGEDNYYCKHMNFAADYEQLAQVNKAVQEKISVLRKDFKLEFITKSLYESPDHEL